MQIKIEKVDTSGPLQKAMVERSKKIKAGKIKADASWSFETIVQGLDQADARAAAQEAERQAIAEARKRRKKSRRVKKLIKLKRVFRKLESRLSQLESDNRELRERLDRISNVSRGY